MSRRSQAHLICGLDRLGTGHYTTLHLYDLSGAHRPEKLGAFEICQVILFAYRTYTISFSF